MTLISCYQKPHHYNNREKTRRTVIEHLPEISITLTLHKHGYKLDASTTYKKDIKYNIIIIIM